MSDMSKEKALLTACGQLDFESVKNLLAEDAEAGYQDPETGYGPLHRIVLAAEETGKVSEAKEILEYLLANGAVWIQCMCPWCCVHCIVVLRLILVDRNNESPGCLARRLGQTELYETIKMSGVYAELLLNYVERSEDLQELEETTETETTEGALHKKYLKSELEYDDSLGVLLDDQGAPVMMKWESEIMQTTAEILLPQPGEGRVLNIGFGMGIVDGYFQERRPESHVIVEAHPAVIKRMKETGWDKKPGVEVYPLFPSLAPPLPHSSPPAVLPSPSKSHSSGSVILIN